MVCPIYSINNIFKYKAKFYMRIDIGKQKLIYFYSILFSYLFIYVLILLVKYSTIIILYLNTYI